MIRAYVLKRSSAVTIGNPDGIGEEVLGVVADAATLHELQHDADAIPIGAYLSEVDALEAGGGFAFVDSRGRLATASSFVRSEWEAKQATIDAAIAGLDPETKAAIGMADHVPEADKKAARAAEREAAIAKAVEGKP